MEMRTSENYNNSFFNKDGTRNTESYNDTFVREKMGGGKHGILYEHFGCELTDGDFMGIDCKFINDPTRGVELEQGGWDCDDFWEHKTYPWKSKDLDYAHINMPFRKIKYWTNDTLKCKVFNDETKTKFHFESFPNLENKQDTIYCRTNVALTNFIIIRPETILNEMYKITEFFAYNSGRFEKWCSFRKEDVESYKIINGVLIKY
jgi:hypothetical protein